MGFLSVLLTILKIIGIIIASLIIIILAVAALVLFVPVRYRGEASFHGKPDVKLRVSYLMKIFSAKYEMYDGKQKFVFRIFGIKFRKRKKKARKIKHSRKNKADTPVIQQDTGEAGEYKALEQTGIPAEQNEVSEKKKRGGIGKARNFISGIREKVQNISKEINDEGNKRAFKVMRDSLAEIFKHIKPQKHSIFLKFGTGDPASTGEILGGIYVFIYMAGLNCDAEADFENKIFEIDSSFSGRIRVFTLLKTAVKAYRNKDFKNVLNRFI